MHPLRPAAVSGTWYPASADVLASAVDKYLAGRAGVDGTERWRLLELVRDLTASEFGGYNYLVTLHGEGSMGAQLVQTVRDYDIAACVAYAKDMLDAPVKVPATA